MTSSEIKVVFATCAPDRVAALVDAMRLVGPDLPLFVVSEFAPPHGEWIPYHPKQTPAENEARCRAKLAGFAIRFAGVLLDPKFPYWPLRRTAFRLSPWRALVFFNPALHHFMLRPGSAGTIARHVKWRAQEFIQFQTSPGGKLYTWMWRLRHPGALRRPVAYRRALWAGEAIARRKTAAVAGHSVPVGEGAVGRESAVRRESVDQRESIDESESVGGVGSVSQREWMAQGQSSAHAETATAVKASAEEKLPPGISVVIPSREGGALLDALLARLVGAGEIIVVDNGSTERWTAPAGVSVITSVEPLSFAAAVNRGIHAARFSHVCVLNNDMEPEPEFLAALRRAFDRVPGLFCATAQIFFPPGQRRQETGKAVMPPPPDDPLDTSFPLTCLEPLAGEDLTYVLYGSGGCSMFDTAWLRALGGYDESFVPAYVEDLDLGYRGWLAGGATVYVAGARTVHHHRTTTARFFSGDDLRRFVEVNYLRFLSRAIASPDVFREMWRRALWRVNLLAGGHEVDPLMTRVMEESRALTGAARSPVAVRTDEEVLALGSGDHAIFPGRAAGTSRTILVASCYLPFPLSHGGAVRMFNLMRQAARQGYRQVLLCFADELATPAPELLDICREVVLVKRRGSHYRKSTERPDVVEEFDSAVFRAVMKELIRKHDVALAQLEFTQMAQYAGLAPKSILIEHDITLDLYQQLVEKGGGEETRIQLARWERFERDAWKRMDAVVVMSERDRLTAGADAVVIANGVDLERFQPAVGVLPEAGRILFIGSFNHLPNLLALDWFLSSVWPLLKTRATLHVIAGARHEYFLDFYREKVRLALDLPGVEVEGFVSDVRGAYRRAAVVIAPLLASAGTNIKVMEAMAMGKAVVSTSAGVHGLELVAGADYALGETAAEFAVALDELLGSEAGRGVIEQQARATVEERFAWERIAVAQSGLYGRMLGGAEVRVAD